jgi:hypothetical protein
VIPVTFVAIAKMCRAMAAKASTPLHERWFIAAADLLECTDRHAAKETPSETSPRPL